VVISNTLGAQLCQAAFEGDVTHLQQAHRAGVDMNTADYDGRTAMHLAACEGRVEVLVLLWGYGARCNIKDRWGGTPMKDAIKVWCAFFDQNVCTRGCHWFTRQLA
jgi:ankyrin repeat protein